MSLLGTAVPVGGALDAVVMGEQVTVLFRPQEGPPLYVSHMSEEHTCLSAHTNNIMVLVN